MKAHGGLLTIHVRPTFSNGLLLALLAGWFGACLAQPVPSSCALTDRACFDENYSRMCTEKGTTPESCRAWLHSVVEQDPAIADVLLGLATIAPTNDERVAALRRVVAVDPNPMNLGFLAEAVSRSERHAESAALLERAYELAMQQQPGPYAWRFARNALFEYEWADLPNRAAQLRKRVEHDAALDAKVAEAARAENIEPARLKRILDEICGEIIVRMLGARHCLAGIDHTVDAADRVTAGADKARLAKAASDAMFLSAQTAGDVLDLADPTWRDRFEGALKRYFGAESAERMRYTATEITVE